MPNETPVKKRWFSLRSFFLGLLVGPVSIAVIFFIALHFTYSTRLGIKASDYTISNFYYNTIRDNIIANLSPILPRYRRDQIIAQSDRMLQSYLQLSDVEKRKLAKEIPIAIYYFNSRQEVPLTQIPNLAEFCRKHYGSLKQLGEILRKTFDVIPCNFFDGYITESGCSPTP